MNLSSSGSDANDSPDHCASFTGSLPTAPASDLNPPPSTSTKTGLDTATGRSAEWSGPMTGPSIEPSSMTAKVTWASALSAIGISWSNLTVPAENRSGVDDFAGTFEPQLLIQPAPPGSQ